MSEPLAIDTNRRRIWGLNPNVFFLGVVSLLTDVSSDMIFTLVPLFLRNVLGATYSGDLPVAGSGWCHSGGAGGTGADSLCS